MRELPDKQLACADANQLHYTWKHLQEPTAQWAMYHLNMTQRPYRICKKPRECCSCLCAAVCWLQFEVHPKRPESELRAACAAAGVAVVAYASLGCGQLLSEPVVQQVAARTGKMPAQVRSVLHCTVLYCIVLYCKMPFASAATNGITS